MTDFEIGVIKECKNLEDSYGAICVRCNRCGRFDEKQTQPTQTCVEPTHKHIENTLDCVGDRAVSLEPQPQWIPVSERLPEANEYIVDVARYYLVQNEYGDMLVARYRGEYWEQIYQLKPIDDEIVAWMPLPKLYVPQERSDNDNT